MRVDGTPFKQLEIQEKKEADYPRSLLHVFGTFLRYLTNCYHREYRRDKRFRKRIRFNDNYVCFVRSVKYMKISGRTRREGGGRSYARRVVAAL